ASCLHYSRLEQQRQPGCTRCRYGASTLRLESRSAYRIVQTYPHGSRIRWWKQRCRDCPTCITTVVAITTLPIRSTQPGGINWFSCPVFFTGRSCALGGRGGAGATPTPTLRAPVA